MKLSPAALPKSSCCVLYLHGEDRDALFEAAEALLAAGASDATRLRVDVSELSRIEVESRSPGLFGGGGGCRALVRNVEAANPKQSDHLLQLVRAARPENRLILCAPAVEYRKAIHKTLLAEAEIGCCEFDTPTPEQFRHWLTGELGKAGVAVEPEAADLLVERLTGLRAAARQAIERMRLYSGGESITLSRAVVADLLGERAPESLDDYCAAVANRSPQAITLLRRLLNEQQVAEVLLLSWLSTRIQQLMLYLWHANSDPRSAMAKAKVFGEARNTIGSDAKRWQPRELMLAMVRLGEAEAKLKGASVEENHIVLERLTLDLVTPGRLR